MAAGFDCLANCCGHSASCSRVCRQKPREFTQRVREIGGFDLSSTPRAPILAAPSLPQVVPLLFHGNRRERLYGGAAVALSLHRLLHRQTGVPKFATAAALRAEYRLSAETIIILTGTDQDPPLERWWKYGTERASTIAALLSLDVSLVTTPNYSLFANAPRWDDLHSMKRIALINSEFLGCGLPAALHVNARAERDAERWVEFVADRSEITHLAYEFTTGSGRMHRSALHAKWLTEIARAAGRPLTLIVRGGFDILPILTEAFASVVIIESSAFMKTMKRQQAVITGNVGLKWEHKPTSADAVLDDLFEHNVRLCSESLRRLAAPTVVGRKGVAAA
ncbi:MAG: hypothetical protein ACRED9_01750 [Caulobacteraceae bacterium]